MDVHIAAAAGRATSRVCRLARALATAAWVFPYAAPSALAEEAATGAAPAPQNRRTEVLLTGYLFASALSGRASTTTALPPADVELSFRDVLEELDFGAMTAVEIRNGRWSFVGDLMYSKVSPGGTIPGFPTLQAGLEQRSLTLQGNLFYQVHATDAMTVDLGAGLRYWKLDNKGSVGPAGGGAVSFSGEADWIDPVIVARLRADLDGPYSVTFAADIGGFGAGSDLTYQLLGTLNYQKSERTTLQVGYRILSADYDQGGFVYDIRMQGPVIGMTTRF
jgi:hypothetical protein